MLRRSREFKNSAACKPLAEKGVVRETATRPCAQKYSLLFRAKRRACWAGRDWNRGRKGPPAPDDFGPRQPDPSLEPLGRNVRRLAAPYAGRLSPSPSPVRLASRKSRALSGCTGSAPCCLYGPMAADPCEAAAAWAKWNVSHFRTGSFPSRREPAR